MYIDGEPIIAPDSAYSIIKLTEEEVAAYKATAEADRDKMVFKYTTPDADGNLTDTYYRAELRHPELVSGSDHLGLLDRTPTLDKLLEEGTQIEQKGEWNADTKTWGTADPIKSPGSSYKLTAGTADDYAFKIDTKDKDGNVTTSDYYNIALSSPLAGEDTGEGVQLGTSKNIKLSETPFSESDYTVTGSFDVKTSDTSTKTYYYGYKIPEGYTPASAKSDDTLNSTNANKKLFKGITTNKDGGAIYNTQDKSSIDIVADFVGNTTSNGSERVGGGAIYNSGKLGNITGDFINNTAVDGGAIRNINGGEIGNIKGDFINNRGLGTCGAIYNSGNSKINSIKGGFINNIGGGSGGAIHNADSSEIGTIAATFINHENSSGGAIYNANNSKITNISDSIFISNNGGGTGGAIYNTDRSSISNISATFINNHSISGGAITNEQNSIIGNITGDFINNRAKSQGGAIHNYNNGVIGNITGDFINNSADRNMGGAISNSYNSIIGDITGDFINNRAGNYGGAVYNAEISIIGNITGDFINNSGIYGTISNYNNSKIGDINGNFINNSAGYGGAIYNYETSTIGNITGSFINNSGSSNSGGAIFNSSNSSIGNIIGDFINNSCGYLGGAIFNEGSKIGNITGTFINNIAKQNDGGAICNTGSTIGNITGDFINNAANWSGGAISNKDSSVIGDITGDFINNISNLQGGGAIFNAYGSVIGSITGNFIDNIAKGGTSSNGGAIHNCNGSKILNITGNFIRNTASFVYEGGGAISNNGGGTIADISGNFIENTTIGSGGAIYNANGSSIKNITGDFNKNKATDGSGGAIYNANGSSIKNISGNFIENTTIGSGGAIYNANGSSIKNITGDFTNNTASGGSGGAIANQYGGIIGDISGNFINNRTTAGPGGAIYNDYDSTIGAKDDEGNVIGGLINASFIGNYVKVSETGTAQGGAIYTTKDLNIIADGKTSTFSGNYTQVGEEKDPNAIYVGNVAASINFQLKNGAQIVLKDNIRGVLSTETSTDENGSEVVKITDAYNVNITGDSVKDTTFYLHNDIYDADVTMGNTTINTLNNDIHVYNFNSMTLSADMHMAVDVDLNNQTMDRFNANEYGKHNGKLNIVGMNLLTDAPANRNKTEIYFAQPGLKDYVSNTTKDLPDEKYQTAFTPIYKYKVFYDNRDDGGYFVFNRSASGGNSSDGFNPAVLTAPVSTVAASQAGMTEAFKYVFEHLDAFTQLPAEHRISKINANKYALAERDTLYNGVSTDFNSNKGSFNYDESNKAYWMRPYATFENMSLKNGPKVDVITYGSIVGYDGDFKSMKRGWHRIGTSYIGYNGSQIKYRGADTTTNGGLLGFTETYYKGNFWSAVTVSAGASVGETHTMYGKEDYATLLAGAASKTGYNFEFKDGKYILQPVMYMSYTFAKTFDYTNAAGVKINTDPAHSLQLHPIIRGVANCKNGWQPYLQVGVVWNALNKSNITANGVRMPEMSMKPYVEYGAGVQRNWDDKYTAFGQAMVRNGGRNGVALTLGFRWALGKEANEKVQAPAQKVTLSEGEGRVRVQTRKGENQTDGLRVGSLSDAGNTTKTVLKELLPNQKASLKPQGTRTVLKQLSPVQKTSLGVKSQNTTRTTTSAILRAL